MVLFIIVNHIQGLCVCLVIPWMTQEAVHHVLWILVLIVMALPLVRKKYVIVIIPASNKDCSDKSICLPSLGAVLIIFL